MTVFVANANMLTLSGLKSVLDGILNGATVEVTIRNLAGEEMTGPGWPPFPLAMEPVDDSEGDYRVVFDEDVPWEAGRSYEALIRAEGGMGTWRLQFRPRIRRIE